MGQVTIGIRRRQFIAALGGAAAAWPFAARAQQLKPAFQVGVLYPGLQAAMASRVAAIQSGLRAGGLRAEQFEILPRATDGNPASLAPMAADLVARKVDLICAQSSTAVRAARALTDSISIVAIDLETDPVEEGFIGSPARPGGNITGVFLDFPDFSKKWLEVLKEAIPQLATVAVLWDPAVGPHQLKALGTAAKTLGLTLVVQEVRQSDEFEPAFLSIVEKGAGAVVMLPSTIIGSAPKLLADLALKRRLPTITLFSDFARSGGLMAYGPNLLGIVRHEGIMAAKVLLGAKPAVTPIEAPTRFEFVLNLKTANALGLTIPAVVLLRADEVIE
jgi:putative tryptophan/tyrosine transport system substrate-binding protein